MATKGRTQFAILGLLIGKPMSGYDIKKLVDAGLSHFWSENYGQIYPTLEQLVKDGLATRDSAKKRGSRQRFVYSITRKGRSAFQKWMGEPTAAPTVRNELLLKVFLSANSSATPIRLIEQYQEQQQALLEEYRASEEILRAAALGRKSIDALDEILNISARTLRLRQLQLNMFLMSLRHGIRVVEARLAWCEEAMHDLRR